MNFIKHSNLAGMHAFLSGSDYSWLNYDEDKLDRVFHNRQAAIRGTELHQLAHDLIRLGVKLPETSQTLNMYVNDAIGFRMSPEVTFVHSEDCFGTADTAAFRNDFLRIHDYKSGRIEASFKQLEIYVAMFCLEYRIRPFNIQMELRIYQNDAIKVLEPDPDEIFHIMDKIVTFDKRIKYLRSEVS